MKRLNLNNAIATTAMLTKTNTMKNKMNFVAKVVMLVVMMGMLLPQVAWGQQPWTKNGDIWYILNVSNETVCNGSDNWGSNTGTIQWNVYVPTNTNATGTFCAYTENNARYSYNNKFYGGNGSSLIIDLNVPKKTTSGNCSNNTVTKGTTVIKSAVESSGSVTKRKKCDVSIPVPVHCDAKTFSNKTLPDVSVLESGASSSIIINTSDLFTSFLTTSSKNGNITFEISQVDGDVAAGSKTFYISNDTNEMITPYQLCGANAAFQPTDAHGVPTSITFHFKPKSAGTKTATVTVKKDGQYVGEFTLTGECTKGTPEITWVAPEYRYLNVEEIVDQPASTNSTGAITFKSQNTAAIVALDNNGNIVEWGTSLKAIAPGTATIQAHISETSTYTEGYFQEQFEVSSKIAQIVSWTQTDINNIAIQSGGSATYNLTAVACKRDEPATATGRPVSYVSSDPSIASVSGNVLTVLNKGTVTITATAQGDDDYLVASALRTINIRFIGEQCSSYSVEKIDKITSNQTIPVTGLGGVLTVTVHWDWGRVSFTGLKITDSNGKELGSWSKDFEIITDGHNETYTYNLDYGVTSLIFSGIGNKRWFKDISVTQKTYFTPENKNSMDFGNVTTNNQSANPQTFYIDYSNLTDPIDVTLSGGANSNFTIDNDFVNVGCYDYARANFNIKFAPKSKGQHTETITFTSKIGNTPQTHTITVTGNGTGQQQSLSWQNPSNFFANLNALTTVNNDNIDLTFAAKSDAYEIDQTVIAEYELFDLSIPNMVEIVNSDGKQYLKINKAGTFKIRAKQAGNDTYDAAQTIEYGPITVSLVTPELHWTTIPDNNTEVFQTVTIGAATSDTKGTIGNISYSVTPANAGSVTGNQLTLSNCVATTISATIAETETYSARTINHTFTPAPVTPELQGSVTSLTRTALTNLNTSDLGVSIKNKNNFWHDISITYSSNNTEVALLEGDHFRLLKSDTCTITAKVEVGVNNNASSNTIPIKLNVALADQTITWNLSSDEQATHYSGDSFTLTATCPANNITYTSSNDNIATVSNGVLTFHNAGTVTITAHSDGDDIYSAAIDVPKTFSAALSSFADTYIGQASTSQSIDLSNLSGATSLTLTSSNPTVFRAFTNNEANANTSLNNSLNISGATTVNVKFYPQLAQTYSGNITISANDGRSIRIPVSGTGLQRSIVFGSTDSHIPRGTIQQQTFTLDNFVTRDGITVSASGYGDIFKVTRTTNDRFTVTYLPLASNSDNDNIIIHETQFGDDHSHDITISAKGYSVALPATVDYGTVPVMTQSSVTANVTLSGFSSMTGYKLTCDENASFSIGGKNAEQSAADGTYEIKFRPVRSGEFIEQTVYIYHESNPTVHYPLLKVTGRATSVDISNEITWPKTTIRANMQETGMAQVSSTYANYVNIEYEYESNIGNSDFYANNHQPSYFTLDKEHIYSNGAGSANIKAVIRAKNGSTDFYGNSTVVITAIDSKVQNISYPDNGHFVALNETIQVDVYAYDVDNLTPIDANITMSTADVSKVIIIDGGYNQSTKQHTFNIVGCATGSTTLSVTSDPADNEYETQVFDNINITVLTSTDNCAGTTCKLPGETYTNSTSGNGGGKTYNISGAPVKSIKVVFTYRWDNPKLTISDNLGNSYYNGAPGLTVAETTQTIDVDVFDKFGVIIKPSQLTINVAGSTSASGNQKVELQEVMQLSYFNAVSPANKTLDFGDLIVNNTSTSQNIAIDYSALHRNMDITLSGGANSQFKIVNLTQLQQLITKCTDNGTANIQVQFKPNRVEENIVETLTVKGYYTDASNNGQTMTYQYVLKGNSKIKSQVINWITKDSYTLGELTDRQLSLEATSTEGLPIEYEMVNDGNGVATLNGGVVTVLKAGVIKVKATQSGNDEVSPADPQEKDIEFLLEPQKIGWDFINWSNSSTDSIKTINTAYKNAMILEAKLYDNNTRPLNFDVEYEVTTVIGNSCTSEPLVRIEKGSDGKWYAYYNNNGVGIAKITATRDGDENYSKVAPEDEKSAILIINKATPSITYSPTELNNIYVGDEVVLARPESTVDNPSYIVFDYVTGIDKECTTQATDYVTLEKNQDNTTTLKAVHATPEIYIRADQPYNECFNVRASSNAVDFEVKKTPIAIEWNQTLDISTGQYGEGGKVYQLDGKVKDTQHDKIIDNLAIAYSLTISDKGCNDIPDDQIAKIEGNQLHVYGATSATLTITASQNGTTTDAYADYNAAENVQREFTIQKITPTITLDAISETIHFGDEISLHATATDTYYTDDSSSNGTKIKFKYNGNAINGNTFTVDDTDGKFTVQAFMDADCQINSTASDEVEYPIALTGQEIVWNQSDMESSYTTLDNNQFTLNAYAIDAVHKTTEIKTGATIDYELVLTPDDNSCGAIATLSNGVLTLTGAGSGTVTIKATCQEVAGKYSAVETPVEKSFTITKAAPQFNWTVAGDLNATYGNNNVTATTTHDGTGTVTYGSNNENVAKIDGNGNITIVGAGTTTISATLDADCKYAEVTTPITKTLTVNRATGTINWASGKEPQDATFDTGNNSQQIEATTTSNGNITYSVESTEGAQIDAQTGVLTITKAGTYTVTATVAETSQYNSASIGKTITISKGMPTLTISGITSMECYTTENLTRTTNNNETPSITYRSSDNNIIEVDGTGAVTAKSMGNATITATLSETTSWESTTANITIQVTNGTLRFVTEGNWNDQTKWSPVQKLPTSSDNVCIEANCTVNVTTAECWDMEIADNGMLTISTAGILNVADTILNNDKSKLVIAADSLGQGTLIFHNKKTMPMATVEMWCKGSKTETGADGKYINPNWQYRGIAVSSATLTENAPDLIYQWSETAQTNNEITEQWTKVTGNAMSAWNGYAVAKYTDADGADYKTSAAGELTNADQEIALAYTADQNSEGVKSGFNLITNSYTAPLNYSQLVYNDGIENGVVLFNTGSYVDWKNPDKQILSDGNAPGQYIFLPKNTGPEIASDVIPSGESFFVVVTDANAANKSITIPYSAVDSLKRSGPLRMPERREIYGKLIVEVDGGEGADRLYLLENENRIRGFENGYDGPKYAGTKGNPMLYATTDDGRLSVSADSSLLGQYIGFAAGKHDVTYTMTFDASALSGYSELYLYDTREKRYTNILDGGTYTFKGLVSGEDKRFKIVGSRSDGESVTGDEQMIIVTGNRFHVSGYDNTDERIYLVDMTGKILWETTTAFGPWFDIPTDMPAGVYIIKLGSHTQKMMVK